MASRQLSGWVPQNSSVFSPDSQADPKLFVCGLPAFLRQNHSSMKESGGCCGSYLCGRLGHARETALTLIRVLFPKRSRNRRPHSDPRKPVEPAQGLGGSGKLAGFLRHLLETDLRHGAKSGVVRRRGAGDRAGDGYLRGQENRRVQVRSRRLFFQNLDAAIDALANH